MIGKLSRLAGRILLVTALVTGGSGVVLASPAQAAVDCSVSHSANGEGSGWTTVSRPLKVGPYGDCAKTGKSTGIYGKVWLHCYVYNSYSNVWWWVRVDGTSNEGWIFEDYLSDVDLDDNHDGNWDYTWC
ncbi:hypothetical protein [Paractinoplanes durhamensis]|uniref:SH3 domain-containing protein n=1 Tax=Paractinoplanes durhamensis TaxID=113563 RepID=A0ABQ3Z4A1_9ACTN|nr:hypothetical protein [Actinoplanes durhamensis]GIE04659.1 hypothetical protein Adu01nite_60090 [Actinoplanes durhamensis]